MSWNYRQVPASFKEAEKQRLGDAEKEIEKEAKMLEQSRLNLCEREKELAKSEEFTDNELTEGLKHFMKKQMTDY